MHSVICGLISLFGHICIGSIAVGLGRPGEVHGTKPNRLGRTRHFRRGGQTGRTINLATTAARDPISDLTGHARSMYGRKGQ
jgi:hypothetical protein